MSNRDDTLTPEEERIAGIEKKVKFNRIGISIMAIMILMAVSVSLTIGILKALQKDVPYAPNDKFVALEKQVEEMRKEFVEIQIESDKLARAYSMGNNEALVASLVEYEQHQQAMLTEMKVGIYDLAKMIQGSRTWLDIYTAKLEKAIEKSKEREAKIKNIEK